jgi:hypothetical protein
MQFLDGILLLLVVRVLGQENLLLLIESRPFRKIGLHINEHELALLWSLLWSSSWG